jgi:NADH-quinone oxidoreductase subunit C
VLADVEHAFVDERDGMACVRVAPAALAAALRALRDSAGFESVTLVTALDHHPRSPRFEVVHQLRSLAHNARIRVLTRLADDAPHCPTCIQLWPGAAYMERECFDMFGVVFDGHAGLKRLLMPEGYGHHPLRKEFPHQGIEPDRLYREWESERRAEWSRENA